MKRENNFGVLYGITGKMLTFNAVTGFIPTLSAATFLPKLYPASLFLNPTAITMTGRNPGNEFITSFRQGTFTTVRELYSLHYSSLCFFAQQLIQDEQEAKDIVLDTFIKLVQRRDRFDNLSNIKAFLYITTRNTCLNFLRSLNNSPVKENTTAAPAPATSFDRDTVPAEHIRLLYNSIEQLPSPARDIFRRSYQNGEYVADIATQLDINPRLVLQYRTEAVHQLQNALLANEHAALLLIYFLSVVYPGTKMVKVA